jgi:hypothetical protein
MMVKMQESLSATRLRVVLEIWHDTTWKLSLLLFPLVALVVVTSRELILLLFTSRYVASVPLFAVWSLLILLTTLQVDGVLRVFAQTRILLGLNLVRLAIIGGLIQWSLSALHLMGPILVILLATLTFKVAALLRMKVLLQVKLQQLLPWRNLARLAGAAVGAAAVAFAVKSQLQVRPGMVLAAAAASYFVTYVVLVSTFDLLQQSERSAIAGWARKTTGTIAQVLAYRREG